jgi:hypothetical protein
MEYKLDALSLNTVQRRAFMTTVLTLSVLSKDEIFPDGLSNCQCIRTAVLHLIKLFKYESLTSLEFRGNSFLILQNVWPCLSVRSTQQNPSQYKFRYKMPVFDFIPNVSMLMS